MVLFSSQICLKEDILSTYNNWADGGQLIIKVSGFRYAAGLECHLFKNKRDWKDNIKSLSGPIRSQSEKKGDTDEKALEMSFA